MCASSCCRSGTPGTSSRPTRTQPAPGLAAGYEASWRTDSTDVLDRYLLALTGDLVRGVADDLEGLDSTMAAAKVRDFAEALTNWYIRRSRDRFWVGGHGRLEEPRGLRHALHRARDAHPVGGAAHPARVRAGVAGLTGGRSVHLTDWPDAVAHSPQLMTSAPRWTQCERSLPRRQRPPQEGGKARATAAGPSDGRGCGCCIPDAVRRHPA